MSDVINWGSAEIGPDFKVLSTLGSLHGLEQPRYKSNFSQGWCDGHFVLQAQPRKVRLCKVSILASEAATDSLYDLRWPQDHNNFKWGWYGEHFSYKAQPSFVRPHKDGGLLCDLYSTSKVKDHPVWILNRFLVATRFIDVSFTQFYNSGCVALW